MLNNSRIISIKYRVDPLTRYVYITYDVPLGVPELITVSCHVKDENSELWESVRIWPYISETAMNMIDEKEWLAGISDGTITERRTGGLQRTVVWNPFFKYRGVFKGEFRLTLAYGEKQLASGEVFICIDNSDVLMINEWNNIIQKDTITENPEPGSGRWWMKKRNNCSEIMIGGYSLEVSEKGYELPQITYPLDLKGFYAIFVSIPPKLGSIELKLTGDDCTQWFYSKKPGMETLWKWADMTRQHLVIKQPWTTVYEYEDEFRAQLDTVRLVPLTDKMLVEINEKWFSAEKAGKKIVVGHYEPYGWSFNQNVQSSSQHYEALCVFAKAGIDILDVQIGRGGCKQMFESRNADQLIGATYGDPVRGKVPTTNNVGKMQQYTNMLQTQLKFSEYLKINAQANFGATNCYPGTSLESEFSKQHPGWREGNCLKYDLPEVREYILSILEEALQTGAKALSIDWCRYPYSITEKETVNVFFRELRALTDRYTEKCGSRVKILTRFPARGVKCWEHMDYNTWIREGLVDIIAPSNLQGRHMNFNIGEYLEAAKGSSVKVLPCAADGCSWGIAVPGMIMHRVLKCYEEGAEGIYIYQCDGYLFPDPVNTRYLSILGYPEKLKEWKEKENQKQSEYSKNIYISMPLEDNKYHEWERLRVWCEGLIPEKVELLVDGEIINQYQEPPFILASEDRVDDHRINEGTHTLIVRAKEKEGWLQKEFKVDFA